MKRRDIIGIFPPISEISGCPRAFIYVQVILKMGVIQLIHFDNEKGEQNAAYISINMCKHFIQTL